MDCYTLTVASFAPAKGATCCICGKLARTFYQCYTDGSYKGNRRYACSSNHYNKILFMENKH